jgi:hypothetical protein
MKDKFLKAVSVTVVLLAALAFIVKFGGPQLLRQYVSMGIGNCQKIPILCTTPGSEVMEPQADKNLARDYIPYTFPKMSVSAPKGFSVLQEMIKKYYYKKQVLKRENAIIHVLFEKKGYFPELFTEAKKMGIYSNSEFIKRVMYAKPQDVKNLGDAFFVIMKSIFIPDVGDQKNASMSRFQMGDRRGFIIYNLSKSENYFNCDLVDDSDDYFKVYIRDKDAKLSLDDVFAIISTLAKAGQ